MLCESNREVGGEIEVMPDRDLPRTAMKTFTVFVCVFVCKCVFHVSGFFGQIYFITLPNFVK